MVVNRFHVKENMDKVREHLGFDIYANRRSPGFRVLIKVVTDEKYARHADGTTSSIIIPEAATSYQKYTSGKGLVLDMGPYCYSGEYYKDQEPQCAIGDWVMFSQATPLYVINKVLVKYVNDNSFLDILEDPDLVQSVN